MPNAEQVKSAVRWIITTLGPILVSYGLIDESTLSVVGGAILSLTPLIWSMFTHTQTNAIAVVDAMAKDPTTPVLGVITAPTAAGRALAESIPGSTVVPAGTPAAEKIAAAH